MLSSVLKSTRSLEGLNTQPRRLNPFSLTNTLSASPLKKALAFSNN